MSGGGASQTTSMPSWAEPYYKGYLDQAQQVASQPFQPYEGQRYAGLNDTQYAGLDAMANRAMSGSPLWSTSQQALQQTAGGGMLGGNPYMQQAIDSASSDVLRNYQRSVLPGLDMMEARGGSFGNSGVMQARQDAAHDLTGQLANMAGTMRMNDYSNERNRQMQALGMAQSYANQDYTDAAQLLNAGGALQQDMQGQIGADYGSWQDAKNYPMQQLGVMGQALGQKYGSTTTESGGSSVGSGFGGALAGAKLGSMIGGPAGTAWGAGIGGILGLLG